MWVPLISVPLDNSLVFRECDAIVSAADLFVRIYFCTKCGFGDDLLCGVGFSTVVSAKQHLFCLVRFWHLQDMCHRLPCKCVRHANGCIWMRTDRCTRRTYRCIWMHVDLCFHVFLKDFRAILACGSERPVAPCRALWSTLASESCE